MDVSNMVGSAAGYSLPLPIPRPSSSLSQSTNGPQANNTMNITPPNSPFDISVVDKKQDFRLPSINNILNASILENNGPSNQLPPVLSSYPSFPPSSGLQYQYSQGSYVPPLQAQQSFQSFSNPYTPMSSRSGSLTSINSSYSSNNGQLPQLAQIAALSRSSSMSLANGKSFSSSLSSLSSSPALTPSSTSSSPSLHDSGSVSTPSSISDVDSQQQMMNAGELGGNYAPHFKDANRFRTNSIQSDNFKPIIIVSADKTYEYIQKNQGRKKRSNLPKQTTVVLLTWLNENLRHPYPNAKQKTELMKKTGLSSQQLSNWFINARRRKINLLKELQKNTTVTN